LGRFKPPDAELHAGIALHYGEVGYGNIGSGERLDFTVIGPDVNLVSRIQAVCSATSRPLLMSERFAMLLKPGTAAAIGRHELRGFVEPAELYSLDDSFAQVDRELCMAHKGRFHQAELLSRLIGGAAP
jgi:adenylate cyclase